MWYESSFDCSSVGAGGFFSSVAVGATSAQVMLSSAHSKLNSTDCHGSAPIADSSIERNDESKACGYGSTRPDTMPNTCLVCHNPHQGVYKDGKWEDQTVAEYNKFAFKLKKR